MSTGYPSSWPHPTTRVTGDTIYAHESPTAKPGHALARPGHCLVRLRRLGDFHRRKRNASAQRIPQCIFSTVKLVAHLQVHPESRGRTRVAGQSHRCIGHGSALSADDFIDTTRRNTDIDGELVLRNSEALNEVLHKDFTRVNRSNRCNRHRSLPVATASLCSHQAQHRRISSGSHYKASPTPTWSSPSISITSTKSTQLPSSFDAHQKLNSTLNRHGSILYTSEGWSARKQLIFNPVVIRTEHVRHQDMADLHNRR